MQLLRAGGWLTFWVVLLQYAAMGATAGRPNVLWIVADDQAPYVLGAYGNKQVRTPNLDKLAKEGMRFERAYCNSPVCTASRQSFLTGRYPRTIGVTQLQSALPESEVTLAEVLKANGYETGAIGKMHFNSALKHGFDLRLDLPEHRAWLAAKGKAPLPADGEVLGAWKPFKDPASVWLNSRCLPFAAVDEDMPGTWFANKAVEYLRQPRDKPFFLMVSFYEPHSPFHFPVEFRGRHRADEFRVARPGREDEGQIPDIFRDLTEAEKQGITAAYYTSTEFMDRNVGRVLRALEDSGQMENTLVIFIGDHGYLLGQHGRFEKHCGYEEAVRSALLVRYPGHVKARQSTSALVEFIDLFPTVLDFAGVAAIPKVQGRSLAALLTGKTRAHREEVFIEYSENEEGYVCTERWKFIYGTGKRVRQDGYVSSAAAPRPTVRLFDLKKDPQEMRNVAARPENAKLVNEFTKRLAEHCRRTEREGEAIPQTSDVQAVLDYCLQPRDVQKRAGGR
jgi:choline-sulfatase